MGPRWSRVDAVQPCRGAAADGGSAGQHEGDGGSAGTDAREQAPRKVDTKENLHGVAHAHQVLKAATGDAGPDGIPSEERAVRKEFGHRISAPAAESAEPEDPGTLWIPSQPGLVWSVRR